MDEREHSLDDVRPRRLHFVLMVSLIAGISYNQPLLCSNASWNPSATTFATNATLGSYPYALFVTQQNTLVAANRNTGTVSIWFNGSTTVNITLRANLSALRSVFVTDDDEIFVANADCPDCRIDRWRMTNRTLLSSISLGGPCYDIFIDLHDDLYCSQESFHRVVKSAWRNPSASVTVVAGTGCYGSTSMMLGYPRGIFVTASNDLYVADQYNHRIQLFRNGERNATTVAGNGTSGTISLSRPTDVIVDGNGYLFIVDSDNHRIVGSDGNGFRCVVGSPGGSSGSTASRLTNPQTVSFDSRGNLYVMDSGEQSYPKICFVGEE